jgi:hypothetical protein
MTRRLIQSSLATLAVTIAAAAPASAQVVHGLNLGAGFFRPAPLDTRVLGDVLFENMNQPIIPGTIPPSTASLDFDFNRFRSLPLFMEWQMEFSDHFELGIGASYSNRRVPSVYRDLINGQGTVDPFDDTEIPQDLRLRVIPITAVARIVFGRPGGTQGYFGGGAAIVNFRYSETGQFVQVSDLSVFTDQFVATGWAPGGVALGGVRFALGGDVYALTLEGRYLWARGNTGGIEAGFLGDKIDLSGLGINFGLLIRY